MNRRGFTLIELMIVIAIIAVIAAIAIPGLLSSQRASNERNAATSLKTLTSAEADFRANDRDGNKVNDFWTANVSGLYTMTSAAVSGNSNGTMDPAIKLIELSIASADADSTPVAAGGENAVLTQFSVSASKAGYWYQALISDNGVAGPESTYRQDTNGALAMGSVHNYWKFGFTAWPETRSAGKFVFVIDENNTIFRSAISSNVSPSNLTPPGPATAPYDTYPSPDDLKSFWSKLD
ncbi:MAG TPA: prepilin-type N-terminal cleavage/methylation domain-containing protein [Planctomycetota bacterium]|nr:prepilin-type N-terminal cleavage/methylation domain-containing protein [Planctomycetota bacterium]